MRKLIWKLRQEKIKKHCLELKTHRQCLFISSYPDLYHSYVLFLFSFIKTFCEQCIAPKSFIRFPIEKPTFSSRETQVFAMRNLRFREGRYKKESQVFAIKNLDFQKRLNYRQFSNKKRLDVLHQDVFYQKLLILLQLAVSSSATASSQLSNINTLSSYPSQP